MSVSYTSYFIIGYKIDFARLQLPMAVEPSCGHSQREGNNYCPVCGLKVEEEDVYNEELAEDIREYLFAKVNGRNGYYFFQSDYDEQIFLFGWGHTARSTFDNEINFRPYTSIPPETEINNVLENILSEMRKTISGVPDDFLDTASNGGASFGIWSGISLNG